MCVCVWEGVASGTWNGPCDSVGLSDADLDAVKTPRSQKRGGRASALIPVSY